MDWLAQRGNYTKYQSNCRLYFPISISISQNEIVIIWRHFTVRTSFPSLVFRSVEPRAIFVRQTNDRKRFHFIFQIFRVQFLFKHAAANVWWMNGRSSVRLCAPCACMYICHRIKRNKCKYGKHTYWLCVRVFDVMMVFRIYDGTLDSVSHASIESCRHGLWPMHLFCNSIFMFFPQNVRVNRWNARHKGHTLISYFRIRCDFFSPYFCLRLSIASFQHTFSEAHISTTASHSQIFEANQITKKTAFDEGAEARSEGKKPKKAWCARRLVIFSPLEYGRTMTAAAVSTNVCVYNVHMPRFVGTFERDNHNSSSSISH